MPIKLYRLTLVGLAAVMGVQAHEPITTKLTWTQEISRIFYKRCVSCHRDGGSAMALVVYDDARPWATAIREEVLERRMPPWGAVKGVGEFRDDPSLSQPEIDIIVNWVEGGAPKGEDIYLPPMPEFQSSAANAAPPKMPAIDVESTAPVTLKSTITAVAVAPRDLPAGASMEVIAYLPDGRVQHLIWLKDYREEWKRTYYFREPLRLPRGTRIMVDSQVPAGAAILTSHQVAAGGR